MTVPLAVIHTNVVASGLITSEPGAPTAVILDGMLNGRFAFLLSPDLLAEYRGVLLRPRIHKRHGLVESEIDVILTDIVANGRVKVLPAVASGSVRGDDHLLALLEDGSDSVLVTGDRMLIRRVPRARALTPRAFVELLRGVK